MAAKRCELLAAHAEQLLDGQRPVVEEQRLPQPGVMGRYRPSRGALGELESRRRNATSVGSPYR